MFNKIKHIRYRSVFCYNNTQTNSPVIFTRNIVRAHKRVMASYAMLRNLQRI